MYFDINTKLRNDALLNLHTVGLRQATHGSIFRQEAVLQVDYCLANLLIFGQHVMVIQHHLEVLLQREGAGELEHPERKRDDNQKEGKQ